MKPMPRFDLDTIAALAEGRLDPERARELERGIAADPLASAELAAHRTALAAARTAPSPTLSDDERSTLHASIASALGLEEPTAAQASAAPRRVPWAAISLAAAALVALVSIAPLADLLSTGSDTVGATTLGALDLTTVPPQADASIASTGGETPDANLSGIESTTTTAAGTTTVTGDTVRSSLGDPAVRERVVDEFDLAKSTGAAPTEPDDETPCLAEGPAYLEEANGQASLEAGALFTLFFETEDGGTIVVFYTVAEDGSLDLAVGYNQADCALLVTYP